MSAHGSKLTILLLLLLIGGSVALSPLLSDGEETLFSFFIEDVIDSDDAEEASELKFVSTLQPSLGLNNRNSFHAVSDEVDHQLDWLFVHEDAARAPPLS